VATEVERARAAVEVAAATEVAAPLGAAAAARVQQKS